MEYDDEILSSINREKDIFQRKIAKHFKLSSEQTHHIA